MSSQPCSPPLVRYVFPFMHSAIVIVLRCSFLPAQVAASRQPTPQPLVSIPLRQREGKSHPATEPESESVTKRNTRADSRAGVQACRAMTGAACPAAPARGDKPAGGGGPALSLLGS